MNAIVFDEAILVGDTEAVFRGGGVPDLLTDTFETGPVTMSPNFNNLERIAKRATFSPPPTRTGRRQNQFQFSLDVRGSGLADGTRAPDISRLIRSCGFAETQFLSPGLAVARAGPSNQRSDPVTLAAGGTDAYAGTHPRLVMVYMTSPTEATVSATATGVDLAYEQTTVAVASGAEFDGPQGSKLLMTFTGALQTGDKYFFFYVPEGHLYTPISDSASTESMYFRAYEGNKYHLLTGARGTFSLSATGGEYAQMQFTYSGDYNPPVASTFPATSSFSYGPYPTPPMVDQAYVQSDGRVIACPTTFGFDLGGNIVTRLCANAIGANDGAMIGGRSPTASFNMDAVPLSVMDPWSEMAQATQLQLLGNIGFEHGNMITFLANAQLNNVQPAELDTLRKYDVTAGLAGISGDDELMIFIS